MKKLVTHLFVGVLALGACRERTEPQPVVTPPSPNARTPAPISPELAKIQSMATRDGGAVTRAFGELEQAAAAKDAAMAREAYLGLRRAWRRLLPLSALLEYAATLEPESDEADEVPSDLGLSPLAEAALAEPPKWDALGKSLRRTSPAARLAASEPGAITLSLPKLADALSRAVFRWGEMLDGSAAETQDEQRIDVIDGGRALLVYAGEVSALTGEPEPLGRARARFDAWLGEREKSPRVTAKLDGLLASAELGAALRSALAGKGAVVLPPFAPRRPTQKDLFAEPVSVATFPRLPGAAPDESLARLGKRLFSDARLSRNGKLSCASCHRDGAALSSGQTRPKRFDGQSVPRDVPSLMNVAYEPMLFWDGRASSLTRQAEIAIAEDMGGDFEVIVRELSRDPELGKAFPGGVTKDAIGKALEAHQRTLISDDAPFDRYVRGSHEALSPDELRGFDLFYGEARCSRCHRLPLTSGASPPRFTRAEVAAIGVPIRPGARQLDPDLGRGGVVKQDSARHAFKIPTLRNLDRTAPYFHHGGFHTLQQVVDFYVAGAGAGLGIAPTAFDPDARAFTLSPDDRRALLKFLTRSLSAR
ncbi:MAG: hypothetical protein HYZ29_18810 [Myxococcales bacterium]|nr:hypothetical protein [Myxococcales bacterium]